MTSKTIIPLGINKKGKINFEDLFTSGIGDFVGFTPGEEEPDVEHPSAMRRRMRQR